MAKKRTAPAPPTPDWFRDEFRNRYFVCYLDWRPILAALPGAEEYRRVMEAAFEYAESGAVPQLEGISQVVFLSIKKDMDKDFEHAVQRGWRARCAEESRRLSIGEQDADSRAGADARNPHAHADGRAPAITHNTQHITHNTQHPSSVLPRVIARDGTMTTDDDPIDGVERLFVFLCQHFEMTGRVSLEHFRNSGYKHDKNGAIIFFCDSTGVELKAANSAVDEQARKNRISNYAKIPFSELTEETLEAYCRDNGYTVDPHHIWQHLPANTRNWTKYVDGCQAKQEEKQDSPPASGDDW